MNICPHPTCNKVMEGPHAILCPDHYFLLPASEGRSLIRIKITASRTRDPKQREYLESQLSQYIQSAIKRAANPKEKVSVS